MLVALLVACTGTPASPPDPPVAPATPLPTPVVPAAQAEGPTAAPRAPAAPPAPGAPPANAADFQPVSTPLGPRESGGVKWGGVKTRSKEPIHYDGGEVYDPSPLPPDDKQR